MEEYTSQVELSINTGDEETDATIQELLSTFSLEELLERTLHAAAITQPAMLTLVVTDDATIQDLNKRYRQQDKPTDVLSFPLLDKPLVDAPAEQLWALSEEQTGTVSEMVEDKSTFVTPPELATNLGDIVVSWPTVVHQAAEAGHAPVYELLYLFVHGILHLVGYDDATEAGYSAMVNLQRTVLENMKWKA